MGLWMACDGVISLFVHLPDKRQTWTNDHSVRVLRTVIGLLLMWVNREQFTRLRRLGEE